MTDLKPETQETLFVTDEELFRRLGVSEKVGRAVLMRYDAERTGFPPKIKLWGDRRYWPAVKDFLDQANGLNIS